MPEPSATPKHPPLFGHPIARTCTRWIRGRDCGKPAVRHVIWDRELENGFVCAEHLGEVGPVWAYFAMHEVGPDCAMPGSEFWFEQNICRCSDELVAAPEDRPIFERLCDDLAALVNDFREALR